MIEQYKRCPRCGSTDLENMTAPDMKEEYGNYAGLWCHYCGEVVIWELRSECISK